MFSKLGKTDIRSSGFQTFWGGARFFLFWPLVVTCLWESFQWFLKNLKCRGFMVQMENYSSVLKASPYTWGPEKQKGKVIFPKPHSRHKQAENLPFPGAPSSLWLTSWCYWLWCSLGCRNFLPFHSVHGVLKARVLKWFAIPFSSGPHSVRPLHHVHPSWVAPHGMA